jgi:hypothetical protein
MFKIIDTYMQIIINSMRDESFTHQNSCEGEVQTFDKLI